jgi:hypothetical protein
MCVNVVDFAPADKQVFNVDLSQILRCPRTRIQRQSRNNFRSFPEGVWRCCCVDHRVSVGAPAGVAAAHFSSAVVPKVRKGVKGVGVWWPRRPAPGRPPTLAFFGTAPPEAGKGGKGGTGVAQARVPPASPPLTPFQSVARRIAFASGCSNKYSRSR